jgi:hypothetical protein
MIRLGNCLDLLDWKNIDVLKTARTKMLKSMRGKKFQIPTNERIYKNLDCAVFNFLYDQIEREGGPKIDSSRGAYVPTESKKRIWRASWLCKDAHIQVCVRNQSNILAVWHAHPEGGYGKAEARS